LGAPACLSIKKEIRLTIRRTFNNPQNHPLCTIYNVSLQSRKHLSAEKSFTKSLAIVSNLLMPVSFVNRNL
jgi:hypothetical protein